MIVLLARKVGPYHDARFRCAAREGELAVIEYCADDASYLWDRAGENEAYRRYRSTNDRELVAFLGALDVSVLVCVGYSDREIHLALLWAASRRIPAVVCCESTARDEHRRIWREALKRRVVGCFAAGVVGGVRSADYLARLGVRREVLFSGWDVVDNEHFARGADYARADADRIRRELALPACYFLCVARHVPKKNLPLLLRAHAKYARNAGARAWNLVLAGTGPQEAELRQLAATLGCGGFVQFRGCVTYSTLPAFYALASALVLPSCSEQWGLVVNEAMAAGLPVLVSDNCGCADDLVENGRNGFTFSPDDEDGLAGMLASFADLNAADRLSMSQRSRDLVAEFGPDRFSSALWSAVAVCREGPVAPSMLSRSVLKVLILLRRRNAGA
jgi:glycosyltransferase involved in cell wall biosynthesis